MNNEMSIKYIKELAKDSYEINADDVEELINQLILEEVISLK